jgi:hypothetical protein
MKDSKDGRQTISCKLERQVSALLSIAVVVALAVVPIDAQVECLGKCEQKLAECIRNQGNGLSSSASCIDDYEQCVDACLGATSAIRGCNDTERRSFTRTAALTYYPYIAGGPQSLGDTRLNLFVDRLAMRLDRTTFDRTGASCSMATLVRTTYQPGTHCRSESTSSSAGNTLSEAKCVVKDAKVFSGGRILYNGTL